MARKRRLADSDYSASDSEEEPSRQPQPEPVSDPETWQDYWSEELVELYHLVVDHCSARGFAILDRASFNDFATFAWKFSSGFPPSV